MPSDDFLLPVPHFSAASVFPAPSLVIVMEVLRLHVIPLRLDVIFYLLQRRSNSIVASMMLTRMVASEVVSSSMVVSSGVGGSMMLNQDVVVSSGVSIDFYDSLLTSLGLCISKVTWLFNFI